MYKKLIGEGNQDATDSLPEDAKVETLAKWLEGTARMSVGDAAEPDDVGGDGHEGGIHHPFGRDGRCVVQRHNGHGEEDAQRGAGVPEGRFGDQRSNDVQGFL